MKLHPYQTLSGNKFFYVLIIQRMSSPLAKFIPPSFIQWGSLIFSLFPVLSNSKPSSNFSSLLREPCSNFSSLLREPCSNYSSLFERTGVQTYSFHFQGTRLSHFKRTMFQAFLTLSTDKLPQRLRLQVQCFLQMVRELAAPTVLLFSRVHTVWYTNSLIPLVYQKFPCSTAGWTVQTIRFHFWFPVYSNTLYNLWNQWKQPSNFICSSRRNWDWFSPGCSSTASYAMSYASNVKWESTTICTTCAGSVTSNIW